MIIKKCDKKTKDLYYILYNDRTRFNISLFGVIIFYIIIIFHINKTDYFSLPAKKDNKIRLSFSLQASKPGHVLKKYNKNDKTSSERLMEKKGKRAFEQKSNNQSLKNYKNSKYLTSSKSLEEIYNIRNNYFHEIRKKIETLKYYPISAKRRNIEAKITIQFTLLKNGKLTGDIKILNPCNYQILNDAALETIKRANPFPPFPNSINDDKLVLSVYIDYFLI